MIQEIITHLNSIVEGMPFFNVTYGLCEQKIIKGKMEAPAYWNGSEFSYVNYEGYGYTYWRKVGDVTTEEVEATISGASNYNITVPLRFFAMTTRSEFPSDDAYSPDRLASTLIKALSLRNGDIKRQIGAIRLIVKPTLYSTDSGKILSEEITGVKQSDYRNNDLVVALNVDVIVTMDTNCIVDPCDYVPQFPLLLESYVALP